jgi:hypothetical protein
MLFRFVVWVGERALEIALAVAMLSLAYGPSGYAPFPGLIGQLYVGAIAILFFYVSTGYVVTTIILRVLLSPRTLLVQIALMCAAFLGHFGLFNALSASRVVHAATIGVAGIGIVALCTLLGEIIRRRGPARRDAQTPRKKRS